MADTQNGKKSIDKARIKKVKILNTIALSYTLYSKIQTGNIKKLNARYSLLSIRQ
jgi:hypothetical protein